MSTTEINEMRKRIEVDRADCRRAMNMLEGKLAKLDDTKLTEYWRDAYVKFAQIDAYLATKLVEWDVEFGDKKP